MFLALGLALGCALLSNGACLVRHREAVAAPGVDNRHLLRSARGPFASKRWTIGSIRAVAAWLLHVGALSLLQLSVVQAVISGGLRNALTALQGGRVELEILVGPPMAERDGVARGPLRSEGSEELRC